MPLEKNQFQNNRDVNLNELNLVYNVTNMGAMFSNCLNLKKLPDISCWNTENITNMTYMLYRCKSLKSLTDISNWNISKVNDMFYILGHCSSLENIPDINKWTLTKKVYCVFPKCKKLKNIQMKFRI